MRLSILFIYVMMMVAFMLWFSVNVHAESIESQIRSEAFKYDIDPNLALAIATVESGLNPRAIGLKGEVGVFQLRPEFHPTVTHDDSIRVAIRYLSNLKSHCRGYKDAFFVCFNYGPNRRVRRPHLTAYYKKVMDVKRELEQTRSIACFGK